MKQFALSLSVAEVAEVCRQFLKDKGFSMFCEIDHQHNASQVGMTMPAARTLIFGKPEAGTKLMQQDIRVSFDLPLRLAIAEVEAGSVLLQPSAKDFSGRYDVAENHPVIEAVMGLFDALQSELSQQADAR